MYVDNFRHFATFCDILRHFAAFCDILRHFAAFCDILRLIAAFCNIWHFATFCGILRHFAAFCDILRQFATNGDIFRHFSTTGDIFRRVAKCRKMSQMPQNVHVHSGGDLRLFFFGHFPIEIIGFSRKHLSRHRPPNDNRLELEEKWAHFRILICRATTYVKTKDI